MASETEKTHALLQSSSTESLISSLGLEIFCLVADRLLQFSTVQQNDWLRALSDNAVHFVIGMWSWATVTGVKKTNVGEIILAGFLASVIDIDHFFLAGSLSLKAALTLPRRLFLHRSALIPIVVLTLKFTMYLIKLKDSWCFLPWMLFISWTSHHIRDGVRHGLWICPFGKPSPLPHICSFVMYLTGTRQIMSSKNGIHIV
ncbi:PREDICTED: transmembrane protein C5orf28-like [Chrysochloris asiatica]|uniref:Transmembrane protein 267 n=1 Tax=Chrysochloris asiatica TaxID=185453 RepID=A0A9B0U5U9_CHRAS|nr:PREDICTED: transmembrane protein C5orf28-like [Chrysochloris asiatica]